MTIRFRTSVYSIFNWTAAGSGDAEDPRIAKEQRERAKWCRICCPPVLLCFLSIIIGGVSHN